VNAARPDGVPPNQGGRYAGFGSTPPPPPTAGTGETGGFGGVRVDDVIADPLGSLTRGWSFFSKAAVKTATMVNEQYVQPNVAKVYIPKPLRFRVEYLVCFHLIHVALLEIANVQLQDPTFQESVKRSVISAADTVQKSTYSSYQALGKQISTHTGVQLPGAIDTNVPSGSGLGGAGLGSPGGHRREEDYDDFWAENGVVEPKDQGVGTKTAKNEKEPAKDEDWENW
jgi:hypothetical protein